MEKEHIKIDGNKVTQKYEECKNQEKIKKYFISPGRNLSEKNVRYFYINIVLKLINNNKYFKRINKK